MDFVLFVKKWDAILRYHYKINPKELPEQEWIDLINEYLYAREQESEWFKNDLRIVLYEIAGKIYGSR